MSTKAWQKIDLFLPIFAVVVLLLAGLTVVTFRGIFSTFIGIYEVESNQADAQLRIDGVELDKAINAYYDRERVQLQIK